MKKEKLFIILLSTAVFLFSPSLHGQYEGKARMQGIVTDKGGTPLEGVNVTLFSLKASAGFETKTDKKGIWKAMWIRGGKWNIDFEKSGYGIKKITTFLLEDSKLVTLETTMEKVQGAVLKKELIKDFDKGNTLFTEGKIDEALDIYLKILNEFPDAYSIYLNVGNCYFRKQEYEKAIGAYKNVLEKDPGNTDVLISVGNSYSNMKQNDKALEWYGKIEVSKIDDPVVLYNIGAFNYNAGNIDGAVEFFKRSVEVRDDFIDGWYQLGMTNMSAGNNDAAITAFENYLKHDPGSEKAGQVREILKALKG